MPLASDLRLTMFCALKMRMGVFLAYPVHTTFGCSSLQQPSWWNWTFVRLVPFNFCAVPKAFSSGPKVPSGIFILAITMFTIEKEIACATNWTVQKSHVEATNGKQALCRFFVTRRVESLKKSPQCSFSRFGQRHESPTCTWTYPSSSSSLSVSASSSSSSPWWSVSSTLSSSSMRPLMTSTSEEESESVSDCGCLVGIVSQCSPPPFGTAKDVLAPARQFTRGRVSSLHYVLVCLSRPAREKRWGKGRPRYIDFRFVQIKTLLLNTSFVCFRLSCLMPCTLTFHTAGGLHAGIFEGLTVSLIKIKVLEFGWSRFQCVYSLLGLYRNLIWTLHCSSGCFWKS